MTYSNCITIDTTPYSFLRELLFSENFSDFLIRAFATARMCVRRVRVRVYKHGLNKRLMPDLVLVLGLDKAYTSYRISSISCRSAGARQK